MGRTATAASDPENGAGAGGSQVTMPGTPEIPEEEVLRAHFYGLLARLLAAPMSETTIEHVRALEGGEGDLGEAVRNLAELARRTTRDAAEEEFSELFYGFGAGGELLPYASYYLTGFVYERPLADIRKALDELGVARAESNSEPEDHVAFLCEVMHGLITGAYGEPASLAVQRQFFEAHMVPWAGRFFQDLERAKAAALYMPVGTIGRVFVDVEAEAFAMTG